MFMATTIMPTAMMLKTPKYSIMPVKTSVDNPMMMVRVASIESLSSTIPILVYYWHA